MPNYRDAIDTARREFSPEHPITVLDPAFDFLAGMAGNATSQFGEDGLIAALFEKIGVKNRWCFEVGAADGVKFSNTWALREDGWSSLLIEANADFYAELVRRFEGRAWLLRECVGPDSLDRTLSLIDAPLDLDLGVIDIDGEDVKVWKGLTRFRPRVMLVEFNPGGDGVLRSYGTWQAGCNAVLTAGREKGYRPVARTVVNVLFVAESALHSSTTMSSSDRVTDHAG